MRLRFRPTVRARLALLLVALVVLTVVVVLAAGYLIATVTVDSNVFNPGTAGGVRIWTTVHRPSPERLLLGYGILLVVLAAIACGLAWPAAGRMLRPLRQITRTARRITGEDLHERLALDGPADELTELAGTFDAMLARLEAAFTSQQLFAANAAHELRTPLAVMRAELDLVLTGPQLSPAEFLDAAARLRRTVLGSERMLERLLTLTRGILAPADREPVPLDQITGRALLATAVGAGLAIHPELHEARAHGDSWLLGELVDNLISNAVKYNCQDGWIAAATRTDGDRVILEISNSGPLIAAGDVDGLLEPFRRIGQQRTGHSCGLGLSIVRAIVAAHGGELGMQAQDGGGLAVRVSMPAVLVGRNGHVPASPGPAAHPAQMAPGPLARLRKTPPRAMQRAESPWAVRYGRPAGHKDATSN